MGLIPPNDPLLCQVLKKLLTTSMITFTLNCNSTQLRLRVLLLHFRHILLELRWSLRFGIHSVVLGVARVVVGKHNHISLAAHGMSLHWPDHIGVKQLKKSSFCLHALRTGTAPGTSSP